MNVTHKITMDLTRPTNGNRINVVEGDKNSRIVNVHLYENFVSWRVPTDASVLIKWERESGVGGEYSKLADGSSAWSAVGNVLTITLSEESTEYSGNVKFSIVLTSGDSQISTFVIIANVHAVANGKEETNSGTASSDISKLQKQIGNLSDLETKNKSNLVMAINEVAANGGGSGGSAGTPGKDGGYYTPKVSQPATNTMLVEHTPSKAGMPAVEPVTINLPVGSDSSQNANVYIGPDQPTDGTLYWLDTSDSGDSEGDTGGETEPVAYTVTANLTNVTIDNAAESVTEGDSYAAAITVADGYALSSVSITMSGKNITGTNYSDGNIYVASVTGNIVITATAMEASEETVTYTVTNRLVNVSSDNSAVSVEENSAYSATLTVSDGYYLSSVSITMGGTDVTAEVYADGVITISAVTGDVIITANGIAIPTVEEITPDYLKLADCRTIQVVDVDAMATEMPDTISFVSKNIQADHWNSGNKFLLRTRTTGWSYTNFYLTVTINSLTVDGIRYGVATITKTDYMSAYEQRSDSIENDGLIGVTEETWLMGNVAARFDASYVIKAVNGNVDESVIVHLNQNWPEVTE